MIVFCILLTNPGIVTLAMNTQSSQHMQGVQVELCDLCAQLDHLVPDFGGQRATGQRPCAWQECLASNKFRNLAQHTRTLFHLDGVFEQAHASSPAMALNATSLQYAELVVLAYLGRHLLNYVPADAAAPMPPAVFSYNVITQKIQMEHPACEYEKAFYMGLLVVSVIVIIFALGLRFWEQAEIMIPTVKSSTSVAMTNGGSASASAHTPADSAARPAIVRVGAVQHIRSAEVRYRALPQDVPTGP